MAEQQKTFGPVVGLDPAVPVGPHHDDIVICSDGWICPRHEALTDCRGEFHHTDGERIEANNAIVADILDQVDKWVCDYATDNEDFADCAYIVDEMGPAVWKDRVDEWLYDNHSDRFDGSGIVDTMCEELGGDDCEPEYDSSDYAAYSGDGCSLWSYDIGEVEEQSEISRFPEFQELHDSGELNDCLGDYNGDSYVSRSARREKNQETGYYENVGPETYDPYGSDYPDILTYHSPGGQWHFVVSEERMKEVLTEAIVTVARNTR